MMKTYFSFLFVFSFLCCQSQESDLCKEYLEKEKFEFKNFKDAQLKTKFIALRDKIFSDIKKNEEVITDNIHLCIVSDTYVNDYFPTGSEKDCKHRSTLYEDKRSYLDSIFWVKETFFYVKNIFEKNIFPVINFNGSFYLTKSNVAVIFDNNYYSFIKNFQTITLSGQNGEVFYLSSKNAKLSSGFTRILIKFKDYKFANNVEVRIINSKELKVNVIEKEYQYNSNQWKLIETTKQN